MKHFLIMIMFVALVGGCATLEETGKEIGKNVLDAAKDEAHTEVSHKFLDAKNKAIEEVEKIGTRYSNLFEYEVVDGDTLWDIAGKHASLKFDPYNWPILLEDNPGLDSDPDLILPKQKVRIRKKYKNSSLQDARRTAFGWEVF